MLHIKLAMSPEIREVRSWANVEDSEDALSGLQDCLEQVSFIINFFLLGIKQAEWSWLVN